MKTKLILGVLMAILSGGCKRCFTCECKKGNVVTNESKCRTYYINTESKTTEAQRVEKEFEVEKGYDNCECQ